MNSISRSKQTTSSAYDQFQKNGYSIGQQLIDVETIEAIKNRLGEHIDRYAKAYLTDFSASCSNTNIDTRFNEIAKENFGYGQSLLNAVLSDSQNDPLIADLIKSPELYSNIENLLPGFRITAVTTRIRACVANYQKFQSTWHQDVADETRTEGDCHTVRLTCWIPLSDVNAKTGALACAPGHYPESIMQRQDSGAYQVQSPASLDEKQLTLACNKGDVLFLDRFLPHKSLPIQPNLTRWSVVNWIKAVKIED